MLRQISSGATNPPLSRPIRRLARRIATQFHLALLPGDRDDGSDRATAPRAQERIP